MLNVESARLRAHDDRSFLTRLSTPARDLHHRQPTDTRTDPQARTAGGQRRDIARELMAATLTTDLKHCAGAGPASTPFFVWPDRGPHAAGLTQTEVAERMQVPLRRLNAIIFG